MQAMRKAGLPGPARPRGPEVRIPGSSRGPRRGGTDQESWASVGAEAGQEFTRPGFHALGLKGRAVLHGMGEKCCGEPVPLPQWGRKPFSDVSLTGSQRAGVGQPDGAGLPKLGRGVNSRRVRPGGQPGGGPTPGAERQLQDTAEGSAAAPPARRSLLPGARSGGFHGNRNLQPGGLGRSQEQGKRRDELLGHTPAQLSGASGGHWGRWASGLDPQSSVPSQAPPECGGSREGPFTR